MGVCQSRRQQTPAEWQRNIYLREFNQQQQEAEEHAKAEAEYQRRRQQWWDNLTPAQQAKEIADQTNAHHLSRLEQVCGAACAAGLFLTPNEQKELITELKDGMESVEASLKLIHNTDSKTCELLKDFYPHARLCYTEEDFVQITCDVRHVLGSLLKQIEHEIEYVY